MPGRHWKRQCHRPIAHQRREARPQRQHTALGACVFDILTQVPRQLLQS